MGEPGVADLALAWRIAQPLQGDAVGRLHGELSEAMRMAADAYPQVVASVDWPSHP